MCIEISTFLITSKEKLAKLLFCLLSFMSVRFGVYEGTSSIDSAVKSLMPRTLIATITTGLFVGLTMLLGRP